MINDDILRDEVIIAEDINVNIEKRLDIFSKNIVGLMMEPTSYEAQTEVDGLVEEVEQPKV